MGLPADPLADPLAGLQVGELFARWVVDPSVLDAIFDAKVGARFAHRLLNDDPVFRSQVPTAENLAQVIYASLAEPLADRGSARLAGVRVVETRRNSFSYGDVE